MVDDSLRAPEDWRTSLRGVPGVAWLLLIAAAIHIAVLWFSQSAIIQPLPIGSIVWILSGATSFLLAAAILVGASRWPHGRRWLVLGAACFALRGVLDLGLDVWFAAWRPGDVPFDPAIQTVMAARGTVAAALTVAAPLLLAAGLWTERATDATRRRRGVMVALALLGTVATVGGLFETGIALTRSAFWDSAGQPVALNVSTQFLTALTAAAFAALSVSAMRIVRATDSHTELLITAGATAWFLTSGWMQWYEALWIPRVIEQHMPPDWIVTINLSNAVALVGMAAMIAGFALAGFLRRPLSD
jgi:hypothetical protein